jgi:hypothetical protein
LAVIEKNKKMAKSINKKVVVKKRISQFMGII